MKKQLLTAGLSAAVAAVSLLPNVAIADVLMGPGTVGQVGLITARTPGSTLNVVYQSGKPVAKSLTANACGFVTIGDTWPAAAIATYNTESFPEAHAERMVIKVAGTLIPFDATTPTIATAPTCTGTTPLASAGVRMMVLPDRKIIVKGLTPGAATPIEYKTPISKNVKVNACGFALVKPPALLVGANLADDSQYYIAGMDFGNRDGDFVDAPVCRKDATGAGVTYVKAPI